MTRDSALYTNTELRVLASTSRPPVCRKPTTLSFQSAGRRKKNSGKGKIFLGKISIFFFFLINVKCWTYMCLKPTTFSFQSAGRRKKIQAREKCQGKILLGKYLFYFIFLINVKCWTVMCRNPTTFSFQSAGRRKKIQTGDEFSSGCKLRSKTLTAEDGNGVISGAWNSWL